MSERRKKDIMSDEEMDLPAHVRDASSSSLPILYDFGKVLHSWEEHEMNAHAHGMHHIWMTDSSGIIKKKKVFQCAACKLRVENVGNGETETYRACRPTLTDARKLLHDETPRTIHHWVEGSYDKGKMCDFCSKTLGNTGLHRHKHGFRCAWCKRMLHSHCMRAKKDAWGPCDLGLYKNIILGSSEIMLRPEEFEDPTSHNTISRAMDDSTIGRRKGSLDGKSIFFDNHLSVMDRSGSLNNLSDSKALDVDLSDTDSTDLFSFGMEKVPLEFQESFREGLTEAREIRDRERNKATSLVRRLSSYGPSTLIFDIKSNRKTCFPLLVFVNPKSGGNQGLKLMKQLVWTLNPRQVFNIMARDATGKIIGPGPALKLFKNTPNLRILVCGGDGTVGWVLQQLDRCGMADLAIPVGTIPLGTGNDMARALKMGGGYEGESVRKLLNQVMECVSTKLDRWCIGFEPEKDFDIAEAEAEYGVPISTEVPLSVINNYFSFGSDASTALTFHLAREKNPAKFSSRIHNKTFYGIHGAKDMFVHKFKNLPSMVRLWCDGEDFTEIVRRKKLEAVVFLNIYSYSAGTRPWGTKYAVDGFEAPRLDDKKIEVVGFQSAFAMAKGVMRVGHAIRIAQCSTAKVEFLRPVPIQVDGEPCMISKGTLTISFLNQATMLCRPKGRFMRDLLEGRTEARFPNANGVEIAEEDVDEEDELSTNSSIQASPRPSRNSALQKQNTSSDTMKKYLDAPPPQTGGKTMTKATHSSSSLPSSTSSLLTAALTHNSSSSQQSHSPKSTPPIRRRPNTISGHPRPDSTREKARSIPRRIASSTSNIGGDDNNEYANVPVYLVPSMKCQRKGPLRYLGALPLSKSSSLSSARKSISTCLTVHFSRKNGWRYLQFKQHQADDGVFKVLNKGTEKIATVEDFITNTVKRGLFICNMADAQKTVELFELVASDDVNTLDAQVESGAVDLATIDLSFFSILHIAALNNSLQVLEKCLEDYSLNANITDICERTPLHYAAQMGHVDACRILMKNGASCAVRDRGGYRASDLATAEGFGLAATITLEQSESFV